MLVFFVSTSQDSDMSHTSRHCHYLHKSNLHNLLNNTSTDSACLPRSYFLSKIEALFTVDDTDMWQQACQSINLSCYWVVRFAAKPASCASLVQIYPNIFYILPVPFFKLRTIEMKSVTIVWLIKMYVSCKMHIYKRVYYIISIKIL